MHYKLDENRNTVPCTFLEWARWFHFNDRHVALTEVSEAVSVSTIFLGLDMGVNLDGPPILFETMVFVHGDGKSARRCATWQQAEVQHSEMVAYVNTWAFDFVEQDSSESDS